MPEVDNSKYDSDALEEEVLKYAILRLRKYNSGEDEESIDGKTFEVITKLLDKSDLGKNFDQTTRHEASARAASILRSRNKDE